jgi:hypothetical protein
VDALSRFGERVDAGKVAEPRLPRAKKPSGSEPTEYQEQAHVCDWLKLHRVIYFAVPNGAFLAGDAQQRAIRWKMMARIGCKQGVPDLCIVDPPPARSDLRAVMVEMKREHGGRLSDEQKAWAAILGGSGWHVVVGYGADDAIRQLGELGYGKAA